MGIQVLHDCTVELSLFGSMYCWVIREASVIPCATVSASEY